MLLLLLFVDDVHSILSLSLSPAEAGSTSANNVATTDSKLAGTGESAFSL